MIIRKLDTNHDWTFGKGLANYAVDEQAVEENVDTRLLSWVGDCFFALDEGVDWKNRLDQGQQLALQTELKAIISQSQNVVGVNDVSVTFTGSTRLFSVVYSIDTVFGSNFKNTISQLVGS